MSRGKVTHAIITVGTAASAVNNDVSFLPAVRCKRPCCVGELLRIVMGQAPFLSHHSSSRLRCQRLRVILMPRVWHHPTCYHPACHDHGQDEARCKSSALVDLCQLDGWSNTLNPRH